MPYIIPYTVTQGEGGEDIGYLLPTYSLGASKKQDAAYSAGAPR